MEIVAETITTILGTFHPPFWGRFSPTPFTRPAGLEFGSPNTKIELLLRGPGRGRSRQGVSSAGRRLDVFLFQKMISKMFFEPGRSNLEPVNNHVK